MHTKEVMAPSGAKAVRGFAPVITGDGHFRTYEMHDPPADPSQIPVVCYSTIELFFLSTSKGPVVKGDVDLSN